jgi:TRAP-type C4-dicarboxylate transport system permease small subunit
VWLTFLVAGVLVTRDAHVAIEMVDSLPNPMVVRVARVVSCVIVAAVGVGLTAAAWELTQGPTIKSPAMQLPMPWFYAISMLGFISTTIRGLVAAARYAVLGVPTRGTDEALAAHMRMAVE